MAGKRGMVAGNGKPARRARGFTRASGLIGKQMQTAAARRGFALARLRAAWPEIAGQEVAAVSWPSKLAMARGPAGGLLTLAVLGAHAPLVQMMVPTVIERVNAALGPRAVGRIQLAHAAGLPAPPAARRREAPAPPAPTAGHLAPGLSSIGDDDLRAALETLARNVLSRRQDTSS